MRTFSHKRLKVIGLVRRKLENAVEYETMVCDCTDAEQVRKAVCETAPDYALHLAGRNAVGDSWTDPAGHFTANVMSTVYLLDALRAFPACQTLIVGSMLNFKLSAKPQPVSPYSLTKTLQTLTAHSWRELYGQPIKVALPSNLIGPGFSGGVCGLLARKAVQVERAGDETPFRLSSLVEQRDFLDVRDAVRAYERILFHGASGVEYRVASGNLHSLEDVVNGFQKICSRPIPIEVGTALPKQSAEPINIDGVKSIGWVPQYSFDESLQDAFRFFLDLKTASPSQNNTLS